MIKKIRLFIVSSAVLFVLTQVTHSQEQGLLMEGVDGEQHSLHEYIGKGQWVVVNVWATACPYCQRELVGLSNFHDRHFEKDAMVLGLTLDLATFEIPDKDHVKNFASTYLIDYPLLLVSGEMASKVTGKTVHTVPMTFFYNPKGEMVYHFTGELDEELLEGVIKGKTPRYSK
jgi:thiol-disulfide isomerase/thioredoxin